MHNKIHQEDRVLIKEQIVSVMLNAPEAVQKQLSDGISLIGKHDFPDNWPNLLPTIIENFAAFAGMYLNFTIKYGLDIFNRYTLSIFLHFSCTNR